jgi:hypothetical protein
MITPLLLLTISAHELEGRWAKLVHLESITDVPVFGDVSQKTEVLSLIDIRTEPNGETQFRERTCRLVTKTLGGMVKTSYPVAFLKMLVRDWAPIEIEGSQFVQEKKPRSYGDGGEDQDGDGHPGVTINVGGILKGQIYAAIREWSTSVGEVMSKNRIEGRVNWDAGFQVLGATSGFLDDQPKTRKNEDPEKHTFEMRRVRDNANCKKLVEQADDVF